MRARTPRPSAGRRSTSARTTGSRTTSRAATWSRAATRSTPWRDDGDGRGRAARRRRAPARGARPSGSSSAAAGSRRRDRRRRRAVRPRRRRLRAAHAVPPPHGRRRPPDLVLARLAPRDGARRATASVLDRAGGLAAPGGDGPVRRRPLARARWRADETEAEPRLAPHGRGAGRALPHRDLALALAPRGVGEPRRPWPRLAERAARVSPHLRDVAVVAAWSGRRAMTPDGLPVVGPGARRRRARGRVRLLVDRDDDRARRVPAAWQTASPSPSTHPGGSRDPRRTRRGPGGGEKSALRAVPPPVGVHRERDPPLVVEPARARPVPRARGGGGGRDRGLGRGGP